MKKIVEVKNSKKITFMKNYHHEDVDYEGTYTVTVETYNGLPISIETVTHGYDIPEIKYKVSLSIKDKSRQKTLVETLRLLHEVIPEILLELDIKKNEDA